MDWDELIAPFRASLSGWPFRLYILFRRIPFLSPLARLRGLEGAMGRDALILRDRGQKVGTTGFS